MSALGAFLRDIDGKIAGIPQCRTLGTTLHHAILYLFVKLLTDISVLTDIYIYSDSPVSSPSKKNLVFSSKGRKRKRREDVVETEPGGVHHREFNFHPCPTEYIKMPILIGI